MKNTVIRIICAAAAVLIAAGAAGCSEKRKALPSAETAEDTSVTEVTAPVSGADVPDEVLSRIVGDAIISDGENIYITGECSGEGHRILGAGESDGRLTVYALTMFGSYRFQNDMFVKISGSGVVPAIMTFEKDGDGYRLLEVRYPDDGYDNINCIREMFPAEYRDEATDQSTETENELSLQERAYAEAYLESLGREAEIGECYDMDLSLLTDLGVSSSVANTLMNDVRLADYPSWVGTLETVEDGVRYVYSLSYDEKAQQITYRKYDKESGSEAELFVFSSVTGKEEQGRKSGGPRRRPPAETLREKFPEYFALKAQDGIDVYVWQMGEGSYCCGLMQSTQPQRSAAEIAELQFRSLSVDEAKSVLSEIGAGTDDITVCPVAQPYSSYIYTIDDEYTRKVTALFK